MINESYDLLPKMHSASLEVDDLERKARKMQERASRLDEKQRSAMPRFSGPWTKQSIEVHLERLEERIKKPVRARNRDRLKEAGLTGKLTNSEILDDSEAVDDIVRLVEEIKTSAPDLYPSLIADTCLPHWVGKGADEAKSKLTAIKGGLDVFKRIAASKVHPEHLAELLLAGVQEPSLLKLTETRTATIASLLQFEIVVPASDRLAPLWPSIISTHDSVASLKSHFPESFEELMPALQGQPLEQAGTLVSEKLKACSEKYAIHQSEWKRLHQTLCSLGANPTSSIPPRSISAIEKQIEEFRQQCSERIGLDGVRLLAFLQDNGQFPKDMKVKEVEAALLALRPFIFFKSGGVNA